MSSLSRMHTALQSFERRGGRDQLLLVFNKKGCSPDRVGAGLVRFAQGRSK